MNSSDFEMTRSGELVEFKASLSWADGEEAEVYFARLGFKVRAEGSMGNDDAEYLKWYARVDGEGHQYLAEWGDADRWRLIFVPDWPTLVKLKALAAPIIQAVCLEARLSEIEAMATKAFRAWHEHAPYEVCMRCDPEATKQLREAREKHGREKANKTAGDK